MKLVVEREKIKRIMEIVQGITEKRTTMPILNSILLETKDMLIIKGTNLEKSITAKVESEITEKGSTCIPAKKFYEIIKSIGDEKINLELEENNLKIKAGKSTFKLFTQQPEDFPKIPTLELVQKISINKDDLLNSIEKVEYAMYEDESRLSLYGIYIHVNNGKLRFVASDGYRLAYNEVEYSGEPIDVLIPKKAVSDIKKLCKDTLSEKIDISIEGSLASFETENIELIMRLNEARFPDYKNVIPNNNMKAYIDKRALVSTLERVLTISTNIIVNLENKLMKFKTTESEIGEAEDEIEVNYDGDNLLIGFNGEYLLEAVDKVDSDIIEISFKNSQSAVIITGDGKYTALVMPIRI
jgi:DNA polymerase-3 subunit beta